MNHQKIILNALAAELVRQADVIQQACARDGAPPDLGVLLALTDPPRATLSAMFASQVRQQLAECTARA